MIKKTTLVLQDFVNCKFFDLDPVIRRKFNETLKFMVPYARHTPQFKLKRWDGKVSFGTIGGSTYINLLDLVLPLIVDADYDIDIEDKRPIIDFSFDEISDDFLADKTWPLGHVMDGQPIMLRDYQTDAINKFLNNFQSIQQIATGAGKTLITGCLSSIIEKYGRSVVIVPSKDLVRQTEEDYRNIGLDVGVYFGERKEWNHKHTICTWQSLAVFDKKTNEDEDIISIDDFLKDVVCVIIDECHTVKGNLLKNLLCGPMSSIPLRWGLTGTIPKEDFEAMALLSSIGPIVGSIASSDLQDRGVLAGSHIEILQLQDHHVEFADYEEEHKYLVSDQTRLEWIGNYCNNLSKSGNTLILVERRETGFALETIIPNSVFIYGDTKSSDRTHEFKEIQISDGRVTIATYGIAAVGINIPRIFNLVLFECGKSFIRIIQSIGRGLRKADDKDVVAIKDIASSLKYSSRHASKRRGFYNDSKYKHETTKVFYR